jgi:hypothetical protein
MMFKGRRRRATIAAIPRRRIVGHPTPRRAYLHDLAQAVERIAQGMRALRALFRQKAQIGRDKPPFVIRDGGGSRTFYRLCPWPRRRSDRRFGQVSCPPILHAMETIGGLTVP